MLVFERRMYLSYKFEENTVFPLLVLRIVPFFLAMNFESV